MGMGLCTSEEILVQPLTGKLLSDSTWTYKIPTAADIPRQFNVTFLKDSPNIRSVMSSKASGEPSMMLSMSVLYALRRAVLAAKNSMAGAAANGPALVPGAAANGCALTRGAAANGSRLTPGVATNGPAHQQWPAANCPASKQARNPEDHSDKAAEQLEAVTLSQPGVAQVTSQSSTSCAIDSGAVGKPFFVLEAPVTTCHGKEAIGYFSIAKMLKAAAGEPAAMAAEGAADLEHHSSGEWVVVH